MIFFKHNIILIRRFWKLFILVATTFLLQQEQYVDCFATSSYSSSSDLNIIQSYYKRFEKFSTKPYYDAPHITKILLLSDLHMDYAANQQWLHNLCTSSNNTNHEEEDDDYTQTLIIVAGDVSHDLEILQWTFQTLKQRFAEVVYTPGNHCWKPPNFGASLNNN